MGTIKEEKKAEWNYRIVKRWNCYMPQRKWLFWWKDMQYIPCEYEYAKAIILKEKWEEEVVEYM